VQAVVPLQFVSGGRRARAAAVPFLLTGSASSFSPGNHSPQEWHTAPVELLHFDAGEGARCRRSFRCSS